MKHFKHCKQVSSFECQNHHFYAELDEFSLASTYKFDMLGNLQNFECTDTDKPNKQKIII